MASSVRFSWSHLEENAKLIEEELKTFLRFDISCLFIMFIDSITTKHQPNLEYSCHSFNDLLLVVFFIALCRQSPIT